MSRAAMSTAIVLQGGVAQVFGLFHGVEDAAPPSAVLFCPPFGWEAMCCYRSLRDWSMRLAGAGIPSLRIDFPGGGDSSGSPDDPALVDQWCDAVRAGTDHLRAAGGAQRVAVVGIGMGGLVACRSLRGPGDPDDLILWGVPDRGRVLVRELKAFARFETSVLPTDGPFAEQVAEPGDLVVAGYRVSAETLRDIEGTVISARLAEGSGVQRVLQLGREDLPPDEALGDALRAAGAQVEARPGPGYTALIAEPQFASPPLSVIEDVTRWLGAPAGASASTTPRPEAVLASDHLTLDSGDVRITETAMTFDSPAGRLFGVLAQQPGAGSDVCAVLLNAGALHHVGPNRMWVETARRWAALGVPTLRVDLAGIGESDGAVTGYTDVASLYVPDFVEQISAVLDGLESRGLPSRFVLMGLCSGAYWSFQTALDDDRVSAAFMLNPRALIWDPEIEVLRHSRRLNRLLRRSTWKKLRHSRTGLTPPREILAAIAHRAATAPRRWMTAAHTRRRARELGGDELDLSFDRLRDRGATGVLVFSGDEPLVQEFERERRLTRFGRWPNLRLELLIDRPETHTFRPLWLQRRVNAYVDEAIRAEAQRASGPVPSSAP